MIKTVYSKESRTMLAWQQIVRAEKLGIEAFSKDYLEMEYASSARRTVTGLPRRWQVSKVGICAGTSIGAVTIFSC